MIRECDVCGRLFIVEKLGQGPCAQCTQVEVEGARVHKALEVANEEIENRIEFMNEQFDLIEDLLDGIEDEHADQIVELIGLARIKTPEDFHVEESECE